MGEARKATDVFISTEVGQVVKINKSNGQYELLQLQSGVPEEKPMAADAENDQQVEERDGDANKQSNQDECQVLHGSAIKHSVVEGPFERARTQSRQFTPLEV